MSEQEQDKQTTATQSPEPQAQTPHRQTGGLGDAVHHTTDPTAPPPELAALIARATRATERISTAIARSDSICAHLQTLQDIAQNTCTDNHTQELHTLYRLNEQLTLAHNALTESIQATALDPHLLNRAAQAQNDMLMALRTADAQILKSIVDTLAGILTTPNPAPDSTSASKQNNI